MLKHRCHLLLKAKYVLKSVFILMSSMLLLKMPLTIKLLHKNKTPNFIFTIFTNSNMDTYVSMECKWIVIGSM